MPLAMGSMAVTAMLLRNVFPLEVPAQHIRQIPMTQLDHVSKKATHCQEVFHWGLIGKILHKTLTQDMCPI